MLYANQKVYAVITEDGLDQFCDTKAQASKEKKDLEKMGCAVKIKTFDSWADAHAFEDKLNGF